MVKIDALRNLRLDRYIESRDSFIAEVAERKKQRNASGAGINQMFSTERIRMTIAKTYPKPASPVQRY